MNVSEALCCNSVNLSSMQSFMSVFTYTCPHTQTKTFQPINYNSPPKLDSHKISGSFAGVRHYNCFCIIFRGGKETERQPTQHHQRSKLNSRHHLKLPTEKKDCEKRGVTRKQQFRDFVLNHPESLICIDCKDTSYITIA